MPYNQISAAVSLPMDAVAGVPPLTNVGKTFSVMYLELQKRFANRGDVNVTRIKDWINDAYLDVCTSVKLQQFNASIAQVLSTGQPIYTLPTSIRAILSGGGQGTLNLIDMSQYRRLPEQVGPVTKYFRYGGFLVLWPTPEAQETIVLDVLLKPAKLVNDTDSPAIDEDWHERIEKLAESKGWEALGSPTNSGVAMNSFISSVRRKIDDEAEEKASGFASFRTARSVRNANRLRGEDLPRDLP